MKVLICSVTAGEGHNSTAKAIRAAAERLGMECSVIDTYKEASPTTAKIIANGYLFVSGKAQKVFGAGYRLAEKRHGGTDKLSVARVFNKQFTDEIGKYIEDYAPDAIIFTHSLSGLILDIMKEKQGLTTKTVGILTDFTFHPYWEDCLLCDYVITPSAALLPQARLKGFEDSQVMPFGIPIGEQFSQIIPKAEARERFGLDPEMTTVLLMGGSMGHGSLSTVVKKIDRMEAPEDIQIISVCGNNRSEYEKIERYKEEARRTIVNFGFSKCVDVLMDAADMIVTKPGGLTTSEALAKRLPMVIVNAIPGQEARNTTFLLNHGVAMAVSKYSPIEEVVFSLLGEEGRLKREAMVRSIELLRHPDAADKVCEFVKKICSES